MVANILKNIRLYICLAGISVFSMGMVQGVKSASVDTPYQAEQSAINIRNAEGVATIKERLARIEDQHFEVKLAELKSSNEQIKTMLWCILGGGITILLKDFFSKHDK
jgi:hypothetical protein